MQARWISVGLLALVAGVGQVAAAEDGSAIRQDLKRDPALTVGPELAAVGRIIQTGKPRRYTDQMLAHGVHLRGGHTVEASFDLIAGNTVASTLLGVHGEGTHLVYGGHWQGDASGGYPMLVLTEGGRLTVSDSARIDLVMEGSFFTRQIWAWGDGTGTIELAEGFIADHTRSATVPDACGTIRLAGVNLLTHHTQNLPANLRPDGRGGIYPNGHVVFEGTVPSTWTTATHAQTYGAQVDFHIDGTIDTQTALTHHGQRRDCLQVGPGGNFMSTGAFRSCKPGVTITKTGPAMLSLDGQQGYYPDARIVVAEGLLRMHTDPAAGDHYDENAGNHLHLEIADGGRAFLGAPLSRLAGLTVAAGATLELGPTATVEVHGPLTIADGATVVGADRITVID